MLNIPEARSSLAAPRAPSRTHRAASCKRGTYFGPPWAGMAMCASLCVTMVMTNTANRESTEFWLCLVEPRVLGVQAPRFCHESPFEKRVNKTPIITPGTLSPQPPSLPAIYRSPVRSPRSLVGPLPLVSSSWSLGHHSVVPPLACAAHRRPVPASAHAVFVRSSTMYPGSR